jgi:tRNA pseudouridine55 synthase
LREALRAAADVAGLLIVDKPAGWTSFDVVGFTRGRSGVRRVGHAGTLDPAATGVLPLCLGPATRLIEYLVDATKTYVADITLGIETDTYDADGEVVARAHASHITREAVEAALARFRGEFEQTPPLFSAIKREGVPLYKLARRGETGDIELTPRPVRIDRLQLVAVHEALEGPPFIDQPQNTALHIRLEIDCSKGFYVRSLAHDLGAALGVGGMLSGLVRTRVGPFNIADAVDIETLRAEFEDETWMERLLAPDELLLDWQAAIVGATNERRLRNGLPAVFKPAPASPADRCRAYTLGGDFFAVLRRENSSVWRPEKVFL